jgi:small conductance mechanosensitive channel
MVRVSKISALFIILGLSLSVIHRPALAQEPIEAASTAVAAQQSPLVAEADALLLELQEGMDEAPALKAELETSEGEKRLLLTRRLSRLRLDWLSTLHELADNVLEQEKAGLDAETYRAKAEELMAVVGPRIEELVAELEESINERDLHREALTGEDLVSHEEGLSKDQQRVDTFFDALWDHISKMESLGLDATHEREFLTTELSEQAAMISERVRLAAEQKSSLAGKLRETPDNTDLQAELRAAESKLESSTAVLDHTVSLMKQLELDTAEYQQLLIETTGQLGTEILDTKVALGLFQQWLSRLKTWFVENGPGVFFQTLLFLIVVVAFFFLARVVRRVVRKTVSSSKLRLSQLMQRIIVSTAGNAVILLGLLIALSQLGFSLGPILAGLGIAGFIVGFALQDTLANFAAGMMILLYRPFDVGDLIEAAGVFGKVNAMNLVSTKILTIDNQTLVVPNGKIWGDVIKNVTAQTMRRVDMVFGISYTDDIPHTEKVLREIVDEHPKVLDDPEPVIKLHNLGDSSVDFIVRPWVKTDDYWDVFWDVTREVKLRFDREGISIPFPQRDVHYYEEKRLAAPVQTDAACPQADSGRGQWRENASETDV